MRGPNPMHGYTIANQHTTLCRKPAIGKRRTEVSARDRDKLVNDVNPCGECVAALETNSLTVASA